MVGQLLLQPREPLFFADRSQEKGKGSHCPRPLTNRKRFGFCQACANRQKCHFSAARSPTAVLKRPFVVTREHTRAIIKFCLCALFWSFVEFTDNHNAMSDLLLVKNRPSPKGDVLLFKPKDLPRTLGNRGCSYKYSYINPPERQLHISCPGSVSQLFLKWCYD